MKSILLKGMNYSFKSNLSLNKTIVDKMSYNNYNNNYNINLNKINLKQKLLLSKKNSGKHDILIPLSLQYKKNRINSNDKKSPYCYTEANFDSENNKNNEKNFKKLNILPKIKENNNNIFHSKKNIYLGNNKFSLNLNSGSALSCGKIFGDKNNSNNSNNNKSKEMKENNNVNVKKIFLKEIIFNKNKSEKRHRYFDFKTKMNKNTLMKREKKMDMNDMIISNDFHGNKFIDLDGSLKVEINKLNIFVKYQRIKAMNKRKINNNNNLDTSKTFNKGKQNDNEKNESFENTMNNNNIINHNNKCVLLNSSDKRKHFKSFELINKINSTKKISKTLSNDCDNNINIINIINNANIDIKENKKNNLQTINGQKYFQKKIKNKNEDIINLLENTNN